MAPDLPFLALADLVRSKLPYEPNAQQQMLLESLARYLTRPVSGPSVFIVGGYAGTGKTSLVGALVSALEETGRRTVLMAPTGRAAKVFSSKARHPAYTIHRKIYRGQGLGMEGGISILQDNRLEGAVYIVDEASMIGGPDTPGAPSLLDDLLQYVFTPDGSRLILLGDVAQLPPVGSLESPAMLPATFKQLGFRVGRAMLTDTARQAADSGILCNATWLRRAMLLDPLPAPRLTLSGYPDVGALTSDDVIDTIAGAYRTDGPEETIVITRSNQRATAFNIGIRQRIFEYEERLVVGERLLVAKNNYMWSSRVRDLDFIANGDVGHVVAILGQEERYGFCFADVVLRLGDHDTEVECKIILNTLIDPGASLPRERMELLAQARMADPEANAPSDPPERRLRRLRTDPYFCALQVKYAYAVTCHKAQGAQWRNVIVDLGGITPDQQGMDFYRWLYTATSRATHRLWYLNPPGLSD